MPKNTNPDKCLYGTNIGCGNKLLPNKTAAAIEPSQKSYKLGRNLTVLDKKTKTIFINNIQIVDKCGE